MLWLWIGLGILAVLTAAFWGVLYYCYDRVFAMSERHTTPDQAVPEGEQYTRWKQAVGSLMEQVNALPFEDVWITSFDGLKLHGRLYETDPNKPLQILFHGYRSNALRDFCGGLPLALENGFNALLIDQRAHGQSEGKCLSFGILERLDAQAWVRFASNRYGDQTPMLLSGISMGAATVLMAADLELPKNVVGIVADCGFSSPKEIIQKVIGDLGYPVALTFFFVRLAGKLLGGFDISAYSAKRAVANSNLPILLIHGEEDHFVPCQMSRAVYAAARGQKTLCTVADAGHGLSFLVDPKGYRKATTDFIKTCGCPTPTDPLN